jgi:arylamine N-acetyltransferase
MSGMRDADVDRYLRVLAIRRQPAGYEGLCEIVRQHLLRVPFENISKLLLFDKEGSGRPIGIGEFLDGIESGDLGGTCYSSNPFLAELLRALGYDAVLLGADMSQPDVHTSINVRLDGRTFHLDVGYAGPFAEPIPLDALPHSIRFGGLTYVFEHARDGYGMTVYSGAEKRHGYVVHEPPRAASYFSPTIVRSFEPGRTFMRCLRITRFFDPSRAVEIRNRSVLHLSREGAVARQVNSIEELRQVVNEELLMPRCPVERAVGILERVNARPFFSAEPWADSVAQPQP